MGIAGPTARSLAWALLVAASMVGAPLHAQEDQQLQVHGFGTWSYGNTDGNEYLHGSDEGRYDDVSLGLGVIGRLSERLRIVTQAEWQDGPGGTDVELEAAFGEWTFSDQLKLRAGKVRQPFGISAEVLHVGTLRPFVELPQAVYGQVGLVGETYKGIGLAGSFNFKGNWSLIYDVYGGGQTLEEYVPPEAVALGEPFEDATELERTKDMVGGRVVLETPVPRLRFGVSAYTGDEIGSERRWGVGVQAEYLTSVWSIRSEYVHESVKEDLEGDGVYVEAAYHLDRRWQAAVQYGRFTSDLAELPVPQTPSLNDHEEIAVGLNYWWDPNFVFKLSYHHVDGNRLAGPASEDLAETVASGTLRTKTNLVLFGAQFTF